MSTESKRQMHTRLAAVKFQLRQWQQLFEWAPAAIGIFGGPEWVHEFVNPAYQALFPNRELLGTPLLEALPEVTSYSLLPILRHVYDTGETFEGKEVLGPLARTGDDGVIQDVYFDLTYQARYDVHGQINGFMTYACDVTERVLTRQ